MIRDRGSIKWTAMMLPEHVKELRNWEKEKEEESGGELDAQWLEEMDVLLFEAMETGRVVKIQHGSKTFNSETIGTVHYYDSTKQCFRLMDEQEQRRDVPLSSVFHVEWADTE